MWTTGVDNPAVLDYLASMSEYGFDMRSRVRTLR
jgi:hypothetical protein